MSGFGNLIVGGSTLFFGINPYIVQFVIPGFIADTSIFAVSGLTVAGCFVGAFLGEIIAELVEGEGLNAETVFTRGAMTGLGGALGSIVGGGVFYLVLGGAPGASTLGASLTGALAAVVASGRLGFSMSSLLMG